MTEEKQKTDAVADAIFDGIAESLTRDVKQVSPNEKVVVTTSLDGTKSFDLEKEENAMTIQEKLDALKNVQDYEAEVKSKLEEVIVNTYDYHCCSIEDFTVGSRLIGVTYRYTCRGCNDTDYVCIPREWLDDGFDYKAAFEEECRKAEEKRKQEELEEQKRKEEAEKKAAKHKEQQEHELYLKLKKKYEEGEK